MASRKLTISILPRRGRIRPRNSAQSAGTLRRTKIKNAARGFYILSIRKPRHSFPLQDTKTPAPLCIHRIRPSGSGRTWRFRTSSGVREKHKYFPGRFFSPAIRASHTCTSPADRPRPPQFLPSIVTRLNSTVTTPTFLPSLVGAVHGNVRPDRRRRDTL